MIINHNKTDELLMRQMEANFEKQIAEIKAEYRNRIDHFEKELPAEQRRNKDQLLASAPTMTPLSVQGQTTIIPMAVESPLETENYILKYIFNVRKRLIIIILFVV